MTNQNGFDSDEQEEYCRQQYNEREQEPNVVPCFRCNDAMYEIAPDPKDNICEPCKLPNEVMLDNWGKHLGIPRKKMEPDDQYRERLAGEVFKKPKTLEEAIKESGIEEYLIEEKGNGDVLVTTANKADDETMKSIFYNYAKMLGYRVIEFKINQTKQQGE